MIVSFSGIDSSGKSTQIQMLYDYCLKKQLRVKRIWGKARGTPGVLFLKELVRRDKGLPMELKLEYREEIFNNPRKRKLLLTLSLLDLCWYFGIYYRFLNWTHNILICDRYIWDTYVEVRSEFHGIDVDRWFLWKCVLFLSPKPDISIMMVIPAEESTRRDVAKNDMTVDSLSLKGNKIRMYMELIQFGKWNTILDGMNDRQAIHSQVREEVGLEN